MTIHDTTPLSHRDPALILDNEKAAPNTTIGTFSGILFDMDGTLIDSTNAIVKFWTSIGRLHNIDPQTILSTSHGRRAIDVFKQIDPKNANWEYVRKMEGQVPLKYGGDAAPIPGAHALLKHVSSLQIPWGIVTSGTQPLVAGWLQILQLSHPSVLITAEAVENGKPDPACYLLGKEKLGLEGEVLVLEDAPAGIKAGKAAGCKVLALATTHDVSQLWEAGADWVVKDLDSVRADTCRLENGKSGVVVEILGSGTL
ncbi:HAD-like protein [Stipitochalara longipes BDJ]|nr:HAD-like protein [Stipitochalara longipes BDJ]